jgi:hypothetical protein
MQSAAFQGKGLLHRNSAAFTFDEPQPLGSMYPAGSAVVLDTFPNILIDGKDDAMQAIKNGGVGLYFFIEVTYNDIFGNPRYSHICVIFGKNPTGVHMCETYNDAQ